MLLSFAFNLNVWRYALGHQKMLNIILFAELTTVVFGLIIKGEFLSPSGEMSMSVVTLVVVGRCRFTASNPVLRRLWCLQTAISA